LEVGTECGSHRKHQVSKRPDLNELDVPEWGELALDDAEWRKLLQRIAAPSRD
jgi:hypothetical protein